jgi:hypothetical protein
VVNQSGNPFALPAIGSPGMFVIPASVNPVPYDFSSMTRDGPIQRLSFSARAETFVAGAEVPEPNSAILLAFSCLVLIFVKNPEGPPWGFAILKAGLADFHHHASSRSICMEGIHRPKTGRIDR